MQSDEIGRRLSDIHGELRVRHPALCRIAVAVYDADTDLLKTFAHSTRGASPLSLYEARLADVPSLQQIAVTGETRVVDDIAADISGAAEHARKIRSAGYRSSLTYPVRHKDALYGFLFFNARDAGYFSPPVVRGLDIYAQLISMLVVNELLPLGALKGAVKTAREFSRQRDEETGGHLERMSRYARLIARRMGERLGLDDWFVEYIFQFAPLHDVGKVAIPDRILLKTGPLDDDEYAVMQTHVAKGLEIIDAMARGFGLQSVGHLEMLRNIVGSHHEMLDGSGYPQGLSGAAIPLEARITAVADVFDALTSCRPYKDAWSNAEACDLLQREAGTRLDADAVRALVEGQEEVRRIQQRFDEDPLG